VRTEDAGNEQVPADTTFLSHKNQVVQKNERAPEGREFRGRDEGVEVHDPSAGGPASVLPPESLSLSDLGMDPQPTRRWYLKPQFLARLYEGSSTLGSSTDDHLPGVAPGQRTLLNTREYRYHLYLDRIRQVVTRPWSEEVEKRAAALFITGHPLPPGEELITKVWLALDGKGAVTSVAIAKSSGSRTIDLAAENAFRSRTFPNPPRGIIGEDGAIHLRWTFVLKVQKAELAIQPTETNPGSDRF